MGKRKKIEMVKFDTTEQRHTTFSKRRPSLYQKIAELCFLSDGFQAAIAMSTPAALHQNVMTFGHPSVDSVFNAFLADRSPVDGGEGLISRSKEAALSIYEKIASRRTRKKKKKKKKGGEDGSSPPLEKLQEILGELDKYESAELLESVLHGLAKLKDAVVAKLISNTSRRSRTL